MNETETNSIETPTQAYSFARTIEALQLRKMEFELSIEDKFTVISIRFEEVELQLKAL